MADELIYARILDITRTFIPQNMSNMLDSHKHPFYDDTRILEYSSLIKTKGTTVLYGDSTDMFTYSTLKIIFGSELDVAMVDTYDKDKTYRWYLFEKEFKIFDNFGNVIEERKPIEYLSDLKINFEIFESHNFEIILNLEAFSYYPFFLVSSLKEDIFDSVNYASKYKDAILHRDFNTDLDGHNIPFFNNTRIFERGNKLVKADSVIEDMKLELYKYKIGYVSDYFRQLDEFSKDRYFEIIHRLGHTSNTDLKWFDVFILLWRCEISPDSYLYKINDTLDGKGNYEQDFYPYENVGMLSFTDKDGMEENDYWGISGVGYDKDILITWALTSPSLLPQYFMPDMPSETINSRPLYQDWLIFHIKFLISNTEGRPTDDELFFAFTAISPNWE